MIEKTERLQPVMQIIEQSPLQRIVQKARLLLCLEAQLKVIIPAPFSEQCSVMNLKEGTLIIGVNSAAVAARLRFESREILSKIKGLPEFERVYGVQFKVKTQYSGV